MARIWTAARRWTSAPVRRPSFANLAESTSQALSSQTVMATQHASQRTSVEFSAGLSSAVNCSSAWRNGAKPGHTLRLAEAQDRQAACHSDPTGRLAGH